MPRMPRKRPNAPARRGKFWPMHDLLSRKPVPPQAAATARLCGAPWARHGTVHRRDERPCPTCSGYATYKADATAASRSTPGFFVNGSIQDVSFGLNALLAAVDEASRKR